MYPEKLSRYVVPVLWALVLLTGLSFKAVAADLKEPQMVIENASNQLKDRLKDERFIKDFVQVNQFVESVINPHLDFQRMSALVLGKLWRQATDEEKRRFTEEFHTLLVRTYSRAFFEFKDWDIRYLPLNMEDGEQKVLVKTEILQPGIQPLAVNYRMLWVKGTWKVYDILIEGVSLVTNYRTTFKNEVQKTGSLSAVIDQLAKKNNEALGGNASS